MPPSYREEVTSIGSLVFLEIARKVLVKLIRKNTERVFEEKYTKVAASKNADKSRHHEEESLEMSLAIRGGHV